MNGQQQMEERLWNFIDGTCPAAEQALIRELIAGDPEWRQRYRELLEIDQALHGQELEMPSLRFSKNVMENIARYQVAPATGTYINKNVIRGIAAFFLLMIAGLLLYLFGQIRWTPTSSDTLLPQYNLNAGRLDWSKALNNSSLTIFILVNVVLGFILLDKYLQRKKMG
jgi:hypothetical protein